MKDKILIFIITYKASFRVLDVIKRFPFKFFKNKRYKILISDDDSRDDTLDFIKKIKKKYSSKIIVNFNKSNMGYGKNIKKCINYAYKHNYTYAVMIHGDNQYDPRYSSVMIKNLFKNNDLSATVGSRMTKKINAIKGGMPFYKFIGNIFLTGIFNILYGTNFKDCHTGYWGYNLKSINRDTFKNLDDNFCFDIDLRLQLVKKKKLIKEIPIKAHYGTERSSIHFIYAIRFFFKTIFFKILNNHVKKI
tara:strand:+ start:169 stop:912 length:744 start_codon:yes stop_codon:yes gene_type:complete